MANLVRVAPAVNEHFTPDQVARISPYLVTTYWDTASKDGLFVGTLASGWDRMPAAQRYDHARLIARRLSDVRQGSIQVTDESGRA